MKIKIFYFIVPLLVLGTGCSKLVDVKPPVTGTNSGNVYSSDATAAAVLTGVYTNMASGLYPDGSQLSLCLGLSADEFAIYSGSISVSYSRYYANALSTTPPLSPDFWNGFYPVIFVANAAIQGITATGSLTPAVKKQLLGEAKFVRAFCYFHLVSLFGDVPLVTGTDYTTNGTLARTPKAQVWQQVIDDLKDAQSNLSASFVDATLIGTSTDRVRPTSWAATALLARAYLNTGDWAGAEAQATTVINNANVFRLVGVDSSFLKASSGNKEAIWQLQPVTSGYNTLEGKLFVLPASGPSTSYPAYLNPDLVNSFDSTDKRRTRWINSATASGKKYYYPYKYKVAAGSTVTEYSTVLRLAEQFLIRAEARTMQGNIGGAQSDLNAVRARAGLSNTAAGDATALKTAVLNERRKEFFSEWGHRWLDLKRMGAVDSVMSVVTPQKGGNWSTNWQWYPLSAKELLNDPQLAQNAGY